MNEMTSIIEESVNGLFQSHADSDEHQVMESGGFPASFWSQFSEGGWCRIALPEEEGGAGMGLTAGTIPMRLSGYHAVPLPVVESIVSAYLLSLAALPVQAGLSTIAFADASEQEKGTLLVRRVPWARHASHLVVVSPGKRGVQVAVVEKGSWKAEERFNLAGEPRDDVRIDTFALGERGRLPGISMERVLSWCALGRAAQMTGALTRTLERTVEYANERKQFGVPIGKFQALQQQIAVQAEYVNLAGCAVDTAIKHLDCSQEWECVAAAKIAAGEAAGIVCRTAHAVHAAIGFTREYPLQLGTRRLWAWRDEYGNEAQWASKLGKHCLLMETGRLWPWLTEQSHS